MNKRCTALTRRRGGGMCSPFLASGPNNWRRLQAACLTSCRFGLVHFSLPPVCLADLPLGVHFSGFAMASCRSARRFLRFASATSRRVVLFVEPLCPGGLLDHLDDLGDQVRKLLRLVALLLPSRDPVEGVDHKSPGSITLEPSFATSAARSLNAACPVQGGSVKGGQAWRRGWRVDSADRDWHQRTLKTVVSLKSSPRVDAMRFPAPRVSKIQEIVIFATAPQPSITSPHHSLASGQSHTLRRVP